MNLQVMNGLGGKVTWINNESGFRSAVEYSYEKPSNTIRVLSIGDSFTAGYRVGQDETYSALLEKQLNAAQDSVQYEFLIANVANPAHGLIFLNEHGLKYNPDIVLLGITLGNDLSECFLNLHEFGKYQLRGTDLVKNPNYDAVKMDSIMNEQLPSRSYSPASELHDFVDRFIFPSMIKSLVKGDYKGESIFAIKGKVPPYIHDFTHGLGMYLDEPTKTISASYEQLKAVLTAYKQLSQSKDFELRVALFPQRFQVNELDEIRTVESYHLIEQAFDWNKPNGIIEAYAEMLNLEYIDLLPSFRKQNTVLFLPGGDMHWNAEGHQAAARVLLDQFSN